MTPKYLQELIDRLTEQKAGILTNSTRWTGQPKNDTDVDTSLGLLNGKATAIEVAKDTLAQLQRQAHELVDDETKLANQIEDLAKGIHAGDPEKLSDYDIELPKVKTPIPVPDMAAMDSIKDDVDGEGFALKYHAKNATTFIIKRAQTAPDVLVADPSTYQYLNTTDRQEYVDDAVQRGIRYHYSVTGKNASGAGAPSPSVSSVQ